MKRVVVTKEGLDKLNAELHRLETVERPAISAAIAHARSLGDLSENAEYHAAKEKQARIESKIRKLQEDITHADVIDQSQVARGVAAFGRSVKVKDLGDGSTETYILVGPHEADFDQGKISVESPIGKGLLGKKPRETVEIKVPAGTIRYKIISIS
ncbi:MAG: transcription elongation factor GreA [Candidatus Edwardsbacteria bacterium]|nr:transcription elongation factor GreA [Candidatus Edwardsbacteria bacterium]